jgi:hypothetical protein
MRALVLAGLGTPLALAAASVSGLPTFVNGTVADADAVNAAFSAVRNAVDDNDARVTALEAAAGTQTAASCRSLLQQDPDRVDGAYPIDFGGSSGVQTVWCDMSGGGWTLVGQVDGRHDMYDQWLRSSVAVAALSDLEIEANAWSSVDAVDLAVHRATEVRLSNADLTRWVSWSMHPDRRTDTWWRHEAGQSAIDAAPDDPVMVRAWDGSLGRCFDNRYGIMPLLQHGGSYPAANFNTAGNTTAPDLCMAVETARGAANGFTQNGNGSDTPNSDLGWPNSTINSGGRVSVWLR